MDFGQQPGHRLLRVDSGSAIIEGTVAMALAFLFLALFAQVSFLLVARSTAQAAVDAFTHRVAVSGTTDENELVVAATSALPGAHTMSVVVTRDKGIATTTLRFDWDPPGPRLFPVTIQVVGRAAIVSPP